MTAKMTCYARLPYMQVIEEELQTSQATIEGYFEWLNQSLDVFKKSFARPDIELLPQTPHAKRRKRILSNKNCIKSDAETSSIESNSPCKVTRQTRSRQVKQTSPLETRVTRSTRSRLNFTVCSSSDSDGKRSGTKPVCRVAFSPPPATPGSLVKQRTSAYEAMLEKTKNSPSPLKKVRKLTTSRTPDEHSLPVTPETLKAVKVMSRAQSPGLQNSPSKVTPGSARGTLEIGSPEYTPKNVTPVSRFSTSRRHSSLENKRRSSRKSLKCMTKQLKKLSGRRSSSKMNRSILMESFRDQLDSVQREETTKRPRTRLRLKKTTANNNSVTEQHGREESVTTGSESNAERNQVVHLSDDDKENKENNSQVQMQPSNTSLQPQASDMSDSEQEVFRVPRTKTRVKRVKRMKVKGSKSDLPRTSLSDSDTSTERPVRQSTRTKTRKSKAVKSGSEKHTESVGSEDVFRNTDGNPGECRSPDNNKSNSAQRESVRPRVVSTRSRGSGQEVVSKRTEDVNVEEENESTSVRSCEKMATRSDNKSDDGMDVQPEPESERCTRTKSRKRQAEEEVKRIPPKRSCTGSVTNFNEHGDHSQSLRQKSPESSGESENSDGDDITSHNTPSQEYSRSTIVMPRSFMSGMKYNTPKPSNLLSGMITSFIKKTVSTPTQASQQMQMDLKRIEFSKKQQREQERIQEHKELLMKKMKERKRKREERMRKVAEHRAMKEKETKEMKEQNAKKLVERLQTTDKLKEEKLKEEKQLKARMRLKKQQEAEIRRKMDADERLQKQREMEEELRRHEELLQRKREFEEQERQKRMVEEHKKYDRVAELERERLAELDKLRKLREDEMREQQRLKEEKEKAHARERAEKEKQELDKRREREIVLKKEMDKLKEMEKRRLQLLQQEEMKKEEQKRQDLKLKQMIEKHNNDVLNKGGMPSALIKINSVPNLNSTITMDTSTSSSSKTDGSVPTASGKLKGSCGENYSIAELHSDDSTDDDEAPKKKIPVWAQGQALKTALIQQYYFPPDLDVLFQKIEPLDLNEIFAKPKPRFNKRGSSAIWDSPIL